MSFQYPAHAESAGSDRLPALSAGADHHAMAKRTNHDALFFPVRVQSAASPSRICSAAGAAFVCGAAGCGAVNELCAAAGSDTAEDAAAERSSCFLGVSVRVTTLRTALYIRSKISPVLANRTSVLAGWDVHVDPFGRHGQIQYAAGEFALHHDPLIGGLKGSHQGAVLYMPPVYIEKLH